MPCRGAVLHGIKNLAGVPLRFILPGKGCGNAVSLEEALQ